MILIIPFLFVFAAYTPSFNEEIGVSAASIATQTNITAASTKSTPGKNETLSEGGTLVAINSMNLLNENEAKTDLSNKKNKIQARKGAPPITSEEEEKDACSDKFGTKQTINATLNHLKSETDSSSRNASKHIPLMEEKKVEKPDLNSTDVQKDKITVVQKNEPHKKPLVLSYDPLNSEDHHENKLNFPSSKASSKTVVADQMPSPTGENDAPKSVRVGAAGRSPDLVVPVVITILVVPVFAVLGYLALKRGQEAWKNRHYKRMDFLLDGMYNE